VGDRGTTEH